VSTLIVVDDLADWPLSIPGVELTSARSYLTDPRFLEHRGTKVFNLCRSFRYQSLGYYVSLLAAARGHKPLPGISTIQDLKSQTVIRVASIELDEIIQKSFAPLQAREFVVSIYFGRNLARRYDQLSQHLFKLFPAPFLRANFAWNERSGKWYLQGISSLAAGEIPEEHREFVVEEAQKYFQGARRVGGRKPPARYDLAILVSPGEAEPPSDGKALNRFQKAAERVGLRPELIEKDDFSRLGEFDALFIRETTSVNHHTYRFARKAVAEGMVVVDDPESILKCTNKVFLAELLGRNRASVPRTMIVHRGNKDAVVRELGLPLVLKQPDSSFSRGVVKVDSEEAFREGVAALLERSGLVIAQEFLATPFDWRVGVFDRQPLYACKYYMARHHWQILKRDVNGLKRDEGKVETLPVEHLPEPVLRAALKAANLIGDGLYGVDLKQVGGKVLAIEVNDNPNIDAGVEDRVLKDEVYLRIMRVFLRRIEQRKAMAYP
jgi:glutathione synthase/RimK-type ligase-like ATP-grasp enzyme